MGFCSSRWLKIYDTIIETAKHDPEGVLVQYPLSRDEQAAMARYLSSIRKQLQDVSDLFTDRYGRSSNIAEIAVKTLVSATLLEHEMRMLESGYDQMMEEEPVEMARAVGAY